MSTLGAVLDWETKHGRLRLLATLLLQFVDLATPPQMLFSSICLLHFTPSLTKVAE